MASINVGKTTAFLDEIFQAISGGKKVSEELIEEARKYNFNSAVQMAEAHNKGEKISAATEKALSRKDKVAETGELKAKESAAIAAQNKAKQDARNQELLNIAKKGGDTATYAEMKKKMEENPDPLMEGLATDINKLEAAEKAAAEKGAQPKKVKDLVEKGGSPVSAKTAEPPAPAATPAPIKEASPTAKLDEQIEDVQDKLAEASEGDAPALNKKLQALMKQRESAVKKAPTPAAETKPAPAPAPTPAAPAAVATSTTPTAAPKPPIVIRRKEDKTTPAAVQPPRPTVTPEAKPESKSLENIRTVAKSDVTPTAVAKEEPPVQFKNTETGEVASAQEAQGLQKEYQRAVATNTLPQFNKSIKALGFTLVAGGAVGTAINNNESDAKIQLGDKEYTREEFKKIGGTDADFNIQLQKQEDKNPVNASWKQAQIKDLTKELEELQKQRQSMDAFKSPTSFSWSEKNKYDNLQRQIEAKNEQIKSLTGPAETAGPLQKIRSDAQTGGDFKTIPAPQADEKSRQITELQRQINDPSKTPEQKKILQSALDRMQGKTPGVEPAPTPAPAPAPTPTKPEAPEQKAKPSGPFGAEKPSDLLNFFKAVQEKASPMSELDEATRTRLTTLESKLNDQINTARIIYEETVEKARTEAERRESIMNWARIGEQLAQAATKYFAAREGKRLGARIGSELKFQKHDWAGDLDRSLKKMESELAGAKEKYGIVSKEVEAGREALGKERTRLEDRAVKQADTFIKAALDEREQQREEQSRMRLKAQDLALAQVQNAAKLNQAIQIQQMKMDLSKENLKTKLSTKQNAEIDKVGKSRTQSTQLFFALYDAKKDKRGAAAKAFADASADLLLTQEESAQLDNLSKGPNIGRKGLMPTYTSDEENKATAAAILQRAEIRRINQLSGGQFNVVQGAEEGEAPAAQTSGQEPTFSVIFEGYENDPRTMTEAQFKAAQAKYGARVKKVGAQ